jgi:hypothetical protein
VFTSSAARLVNADKRAAIAWVKKLPEAPIKYRSNPLRHFRIDRSVEEIGWNLWPFGGPPTGPLIGLQF